MADFYVSLFTILSCHFTYLSICRYQTVNVQRVYSAYIKLSIMDHVLFIFESCIPSVTEMKTEDDKIVKM